MQNGTVILKDYFLQWNKPIRILSSWQRLWICKRYCM